MPAAPTPTIGGAFFRGFIGLNTFADALYGELGDLGLSDRSRSAGFIEGGGSIGLTTPMLGSGVRFQLRFAAMAGRELTSTDPLTWYRYGISIGSTF